MAKQCLVRVLYKWKVLRDKSKSRKNWEDISDDEQRIRILVPFQIWRNRRDARFYLTGKEYRLPIKGNCALRVFRLDVNDSNYHH